MRSFETIEELHLALLGFKQTYNEQWMLEKHDHRSPASSDWWTRPRRSANTFKPLSKNPEALHFHIELAE